MKCGTGLRMKKIRINNEICKKHMACSITFIILFILWIGIMLYMKYAPFGSDSMLQNDAIHQYYPLFAQYRDRLRLGSGIFYSSGGGLGFNFYVLWTYYLSSPMNLLLVFCPVSQIDSAMNLLIVVKIIFAGSAFAYYLECRSGQSNLKIIPFALGYALSTYILGYSYNIMWMDSLALFPVILAGLECLLKEGKWIKYTLTLALSLWCSFYISFIICLFLVLWFLLYEHSSLKQFLKKGIQFAGCSILSAGLACAVLLPAYIGLAQSQGKTSFPDFDWMGKFSEIFAGKEGGIFAFSDPLSLNNEVSYPANLYCGVFVVGLTVLYFMAKDIALLKKLKAAWLIMVLILSFNNQALNYIWHGFHYQVGIPNRFSFLLLFLLLVLSYEAFLRIKSYQMYQIVASGTVTVLLYGTLYLLEKENVTYRMLCCTVIFVVAYMVFQLFVKCEEKNGFTQKLLLAFMCLELCANAVIGNQIQTGVCVDAFFRDKQSIQKMADFLQKDTYRTELSNPTVKNEGLAYNLRGTGIFSSMTNPDTITLLHNIGFATSSNSYAPSGSTPVLNTLFGIKNYLVLDTDVNRLDYSYKKSKKIGSVTSYENEQVLPIAFLCEDSVQKWGAMKENFFLNQMELLELVTGKEYEIYNEQKYKLIETNDVKVEALDEHQQFTYLAAKGLRNDHVVFEAEVEEEEDIYIRLQARYSGKTSIYINDQPIAYKDLSSAFYHVGKVQKGDKIRVEIGIQENSPTYGMISMAMYAYHADVMEEVYKVLEKGAMKVSQWEDGLIKGSVTVQDTKSTLFTSIPYEKGWEAYVDGKKQKIQTVQGAFLMLKLEEGMHEIVFTYEVPGLYAGIIVTLISVSVFIGAVLISKKRFREKKNDKGRAD